MQDQSHLEEDEQHKGLWSTLLENASAAQKTPEKHLLVLGGTVESQNEFVRTLSSRKQHVKRAHDRRRARNPAIANKYALGYTYHDMIDTDQDDVIAHLSIHLLASSQIASAPLLKQLLNTTSIPDTLVVILLDWNNPWLWIRQLQEWLLVLRRILGDVEDDVKAALDANATLLRQNRNSEANPLSMTKPEENTKVRSVGSVEWDEALGLPICIVCQHAERILSLERERNWRDAQFDFIQQYLRTIILKYGGSLIYIASSRPNQLQSLLRSTLDVHSPSQRETIKPNVIDRENTLVPANWDSWSKIRILNDEFPTERVSKAWSIEMHSGSSLPSTPDGEGRITVAGETAKLYEATINGPNMHRVVEAAVEHVADLGMEVEGVDMQRFLAQQLKDMEPGRGRRKMTSGVA